MKELKVDNWILTCNVNIHGYIFFSLKEQNARLNIKDNKIIKLDFFHSDLGYYLGNSFETIRNGVKSWLLNYNNILAEKSSEFINDFISNDDNLVINNVDVNTTSNIN